MQIAKGILHTLKSLRISLIQTQMNYSMRINSHLQLPHLFILLAFFNYSCDHYNENVIINYSCSGVVTKKFIDHDNHSASTLLVQGKGGKFDACYITSYDSNAIYLYKKVVVGDSIIKKAGSKTYHIKSLGKDYFYKYK